MHITRRIVDLPATNGCIFATSSKVFMNQCISSMNVLIPVFNAWTAASTSSAIPVVCGTPSILSPENPHVST